MSPRFCVSFVLGPELRTATAVNLARKNTAGLSPLVPFLALQKVLPLTKTSLITTLAALLFGDCSCRAINRKGSILSYQSTVPLTEAGC